MKKLVAFTLAETLIVMGIIGIVSALTLPNLNSSTGEKEKVAKVKKLNRDLADALGRAVAVYGPVEEWFINDNTYTLQATRFGERLTEFMKVSKNCGFTGKGCFKEEKTRCVLSTSDRDLYSDTYKFLTADGTAVAAYITGAGVGGPYIGDGIYVDIDGPTKGKNIFGNDIFCFRVSNDTIVTLTDTPTNVVSFLTTAPAAHAPTYWVLNYDNLDYLKVNSSGKCTNNNNVTLNAAANPPVVTCK